MIKFGTDGWRGIIAADFTYTNVRLVAGAIGAYIREHALADRGVVVGYDSRFLSERFAAEAADELQSQGIAVYLGGKILPTPVVAFAVQHYGAGGAIMITASHNPPEYNGMKFIPEYAGPALPDVTAEIEEKIKLGQRFKHRSVTTPAAPRIIYPDAAYEADLLKKVDQKSIAKANLTVVVDPLFGAGVGYLERLLERVGVRVKAINNYRDPLFGGGMPEPSAARLQTLRREVLREGAHLGLSLDGDGDRFGLIDSDGTYITPNQLLPLIYYHLLAKKNRTGPAVRTVATTHLLDCIARDYGQRVLETPVGFKYIGQALREQGCLLGGEESGGLSVAGHVPEKDGVLASMLTVEMVALHGQSLGELLAALYRRYGTVVSGRLDIKTTPEKKAAVMQKIGTLAPDRLAGLPVTQLKDTDGLKLEFGEGAWVLVRSSGTEPLFRIYAEGQCAKQLSKLQEDFRQLLGL